MIASVNRHNMLKLFEVANMFPQLKLSCTYTSRVYTDEDARDKHREPAETVRVDRSISIWSAAMDFVVKESA